MSEEEGTAAEESQEIQQDDEGSTVDEIVEIAKAVGWKDGGPLDARTFLKTMPGRFHDNTKATQELRKTVEGMTKHFARTVETQVKNRLSEMETQKEAAILAGDVNQVKQIDRQIKEIEKTEIPAKSDIDPEVLAFVNRNPWFDNDIELTEVAVALNKAYLKKNPHASSEEVLLYVEKRMKDKFLDKSDDETVKKPRMSAVESPSAAVGRTEKWQSMKSKMTQQQKDIMADLLNQKINGQPLTTEKDVIESFMAAGAL